MSKPAGKSKKRTPTSTLEEELRKREEQLKETQRLVYLGSCEYEELEERVVERTRQLTALNEELMKEIADRKRAQEELRRSEAYLAVGQRLSHTGSGAWNVSTGEVFWSEETYRICDFEPGTAKPSYEMFFELVHPDERLSLVRAAERAVRERSDYDLEFRIVRADGAIRNIHSVGHSISNEYGDLTEVVGRSWM